jgi:hypothetical protein
MLPAAARATADFIPLDEITPGMTGYGLTVFAGTAVDTFAVTVVGVQEGVRAAGSILLIEVAGHGLEKSAVAQGMSGSPIYLDGRFAGALAFGWGGALRPLAGVTPAAEILALPDRPAADAARSLGAPPDLRSLVEPGLGAELAMTLFGAAATPGAASDLPTEWPRPETLARRLMAAWLPDLASADDGPAGWICRPVGTPLAATTGSTGAPAAGLKAGSACAIPLVRGDAQLGVLGTVTRVDGDRVLMMGHPFMQRGPVDLPLATAEILTVFPSRQMSFKMGTLGEVVGTVHSDQRAGLAGRLGPAPRMIPVTVDVTGESGASRRFEFTVADDPQFTPALVFWTLYNALLVEGDDASRQTLAYEVRSAWSGHPSLAEPLVAAGVVAGPGGAMGLASEWMAPLAVLADNPHRPLRLEGVEASFTLSRPMDTAAITGLRAPRSLAADAGPVVLGIELEPRRDEPRTLEVSLELPDHLEPGPYRIAVASAAEFFALESQRAAGRFQEPSLPNTVALLRTGRSPATLVVGVFAPGSAVVVQGAELAGMPPSRGRLVRSGNMQATPVLADLVARIEIPLDLALTGNAVRALTLTPAAEPFREERRP